MPVAFLRIVTLCLFCQDHQHFMLMNSKIPITVHPLMVINEGNSAAQGHAPGCPQHLLIEAYQNYFLQGLSKPALIDRFNI
jgi:hypothetical protein